MFFALIVIFKKYKGDFSMKVTPEFFKLTTTLPLLAAFLVRLA